MKMRAAVLDKMGATPPYAISKPLTIDDRRSGAARARRGADQDRGRRPVPLRSVGHQRRPPAAHADGARPRSRGHRRRARRRREGSEASAITSWWSSFRAAATAHRAPKAAPPCANRAPRPTAQARCCRARGVLRAGRPLNHHLGCSVFAEYATVSRHSLVKIDPTVPLDEAALFGCAVLTGVGAVVNTAKVSVGPRSPSIGLGGVGLAALIGAQARRGAADHRRRPLDDKLQQAIRWRHHVVNAASPMRSSRSGR